MRKRLIKLKDARGEPRSLITHAKAVRAGADHDRLCAVGAVSTRLRCTLESGLLIFGAGYVPPLLLWLIIEGGTLREFGSGLLVAVGISSLFGILMGVLMAPRSRGRRILAQGGLLSQGICPHCAHGISGIPPEPDGCTVCPECGAAWQVGSVVNVE